MGFVDCSCSLTLFYGFVNERVNHIGVDLVEICIIDNSICNEEIVMSIVSKISLCHGQ